MVQVKFKRFGSNSAFGGFAPGDVLRVSDEMAKHLVDQDVAVYVEQKQPAAIEPVTQDAEQEAPRKERKKK
jgi:hypothetical protein